VFGLGEREVVSVAGELYYVSLTLDVGTYRVSHNVGKKLPLLVLDP
jgi:hypothetical protein